MELMGLANFQNVFIGIETPNEESLRETKKLQNVRPNAGSLIERVHRIQDHGIDVWCGMIVGFDHDDPTIFKAVPEFLTRARISTALVGIFHAIPTTPLYKRLREAGRLNNDEGYGPIRHECYSARHVVCGAKGWFYPDRCKNAMRSDSFSSGSTRNFSIRILSSRCMSCPTGRIWRMAWAKRAFLNYVRLGSWFASVVPGEGDPNFAIATASSWRGL